MSRMVGTVSRGVRAPIIRSGDDLVEIVTKSVLEAAAQPEDGFAIRDRDVVAMTEAIVARAQGNYASVDDIAADVKEKLGGETVGVIFPILSRNRFAVCLRGIAKGAKKIVLMLSYPSDEVGNHLIDPDVMDEKGVDLIEWTHDLRSNTGSRKRILMNLFNSTLFVTALFIMAFLLFILSTLCV